MTKAMSKVAVLAALAVAMAAGAAVAGVEKEVVNSGPQNWADLFKGKISFKEFLDRESRRQPGEKCGEGYVYETRGDEGAACWAKPGHGASVTCEVLGYEDVNEGEAGVVRRPKLGNCTSSWGGTGGWAGDGPANPGEQAP